MHETELHTGISDQDLREGLRRAEEAFRRTEARYRALLDITSPVVWSWSPAGGTGDFTATQRWWEELTGQPPDEQGASATGWLDVVHPDDRAAAGAAWGGSIQGGVPYDIEYRVRAKVGGWRYVHARGVPVRGPDGAILEWVGTLADVTDRRAAEDARRAGEERFRGLMEQAPFSVQIFAPDGRTLGVNRAWEELWGHRLEQLADYNLLTDPQLAAKGIAPLLRRAAAGEAVHIPAVRYDVDETLPGRSAHPDPHRWVSAVAYPLKDPDGRVREVVLVHQDITAQVRAQEAIRRNEAWLQTVTDSLPVLVSYVDHDLRYRFANRAYEEWFGVPAAAVLGRSLPEVLGEADFRLRRGAVEAALGGQSVRFEAPTHHRALGERATEVTYTPHREGGEVVGFFVHAHDVTDRVRAEAAVRASEAEFRATFERAGVGKGQADPATGRLTRVNPKLCELLGYSADELVGMTIRELTHPDDRAAGGERFRALVAGEVDQYAVEKRYLRKGGEPVWVRVTATMVRAPDGRPVRATAIIEDVTARIRAEEALREADRRKDAFIAMLAHELRNPLGPIGNAVQVLGASRDAATVERVRELIGRQVAHLSRIVSDLLDVSRVTRGNIDLRPERLDLARLAAVVVGDEAAAFEAAGVRLAVTVPDTPVWVSGDRTRLTQVITNLLANAVKFTDPGGAVRVEVRAGGVDAVLAVTDTGVGIEAGLLPHLFQAFTQADTTLDRSRGGLGLGLAVVKGLVELHGGTVRAESGGPGAGATFTVRLPRVGEPAALTSAAPPPRVGGSRPLRVLVVEDNRDAADSLQLLLELTGCAVRVAYTGPDGVAAAVEMVPDLVICDIGLPGISGYEVARRIRAEVRGGTPVLVALTGYGGEDDRRRAREAGFDRHFTKPVDPTALGQLLAG